MKNRKFKIIISVLLVVLGIALIICAKYTSEDRSSLLLFETALLCFATDLLFLIQVNNSVKDKNTRKIFIIMAIITLIILLTICLNLFNVSCRLQYLLLVEMFTVSMSYSLLRILYETICNTLKCREKVNAECISVIEKGSAKAVRYYPKYIYWHNGRKYTSTSFNTCSFFRKLKLKKHKNTVIKIDPNKPSLCRTLGIYLYLTIIGYSFMSLVFIMACIGLIFNN